MHLGLVGRTKWFSGGDFILVALLAELTLRAALLDAVAMRRRVLGLRRFRLKPGEKKDRRHHTDADQRANLL